MPSLKSTTFSSQKVAKMVTMILRLKTFYLQAGLTYTLSVKAATKCSDKTLIPNLRAHNFRIFVHVYLSASLYFFSCALLSVLEIGFVWLHLNALI